MRKEKIIILFTVFVDVLGIGIVIPVLPFYVQEFGAGATTVTVLFSVFSLFAFLSSPWLGALSDRVGRRPVLIWSIISTAIGWFVFAGATTIPMLFVGRIIDGIAAGNLSIAQSTLVDIAKDDKERTQNLGIMGAAFGIGFMVGPLIGGLLSPISHSAPFWFAGGLAAVNAIVAYFLLPETHHDLNKEGKISVNPIAPLLRAARDTKVRPLYFSWIMFTLAFVTSQSVYALFVEDVFGFDAFTTGLTFTAMGLLVAVNQTVGLKYFWLRRFTEARLETMMFSLMLAALVLFATQSFVAFIISSLLMPTGHSVLRVVITSQVAGQADAKTKGEKLGTMSSLMSACMVIAPMIAGPLFEAHPSAPYVLASFYVIAGLVAALYFQRRQREADRSAHDTPPPHTVPVEAQGSGLFRPGTQNTNIHE